MATRSQTSAAMKTKLRDAFRQHLGVDRLTASQLLTNVTLQDKAYELAALIEVMSQLKAFRPGLTFTLEQGNSLVFRAKGGPIQRTQWPYIRVDDGNKPVAELWVDIECLAISAGPAAKAATGYLYGKCHELDIVLVRPKTDGRPLPKEIFIGVEAKHREFNKALLKELLGVRREMMMRTGMNRRPNPFWFIWWANYLPAKPASALIAYCSSDSILKYESPAEFWGIKMEYLPF